MKEFKLSPSDFAFLWEECKCCFYLKVVRKFDRPHMAFPGIFRAIDSAMTACYNGRRTLAIADGMPDGIIRLGQKWVRSRPIDLGIKGCTCHISGRLDALVELENNTWGVIDFKTTKARGEHISLYSRQLHAYAHALENPARPPLISGLVTNLGLLVFEPTSFVHNTDQTADLKGRITWVEIRRNDAAFFDFLCQVAAVLSQPEPPDPAPDCPWCAYRQDSREFTM
ncbi:MAG: PD-(D/E)XK nuclease family protein [Anaerolineae bacterium]|nr:PD-(D/E)XK nuclease family protein [Anaerolineae bacterium]